MDSKQRHFVNKYIDLFLRWKMLISLLLLLSLPVGLGVYLYTPKVYQAWSLLSYQQQKISPNKLSPDVASRIRDIVSTLTQIVTSRTNLEDLIVYYALYPEQRKKLPMEDVVESMRKMIEIEPSNQGDIFKITFNYSNPEKVVKITNALATKFIEENLKYREERASETSSYTSDELNMAKEMMDRKESAMRDYKIQYYNEMPEQRETNVSRLIALQEQYQDKQESIQDLERTLVLIQDQVGNRKTVLEGEELQLDSLEKTDGQGFEKTMTVQQQLAAMKLRLDRLLTRYTEKHPEVKRARSIIEKLEKDVKLTVGSVDQPLPEDSGINSVQDAETGGLESLKMVDKVVLQLETQQKNVQLNIENIKAEKEQLKETIAQYERWVTVAPVREAEWSALTREYGQLKRHYEYLVSQDLEAKSMLNLERRQKGSQFKIEDPARTPVKPIKPNFMIILGISALGGLGIGVLSVLGIDFLDSSFRDPEMIEPILRVPLLTTIPYVETKIEGKKKIRKNWFATFLLIVVVLAVTALFFGAWIRGYIAL